MKPQIRKIKVQGSAYNLLRKYGQLNKCPIPIEDIAFGEHMEFSFESLVGCEARLVRLGENRGYARISDRIREEGRKRFTIAHELGHFLLHPNITQVFECTTGDLTDYRKNPIEIEANLFASEVLMPSSQFKELSKTTDPTFEGMVELAKIFNVSITAAAIRFIDCGPIENMVLLRTNSKGQVKWCKPRQDNFRYWIEKDTQIDPRTMTFCSLKEKTSIDQTYVNRDLWYPTKSTSRILEECLYMNIYDCTLTLLILG